MSRGLRYRISCYWIIDNASDPIKVRPPEEWASSATEHNAIKQARAFARGDLIKGPQNLMEVRDGRRVVARVWAIAKKSVRGQVLSMRVRPVDLDVGLPIEIVDEISGKGHE